jgi:hypothetical protein
MCPIARHFPAFFGPAAVPHLLTRGRRLQGILTCYRKVPSSSLSTSWKIDRPPDKMYLGICCRMSRFIIIHSFKQERFLKDGKINKDIRDPTTMAFGYGYRYQCCVPQRRLQDISWYLLKRRECSIPIPFAPSMKPRSLKKQWAGYSLCHSRSEIRVFALKSWDLGSRLEPLHPLKGFYPCSVQSNRMFRFEWVKLLRVYA